MFFRLETRAKFWDLFVASFGALFFEMLLVRWLPTTIYYLGYYKNCILFATFLGFGCGAATRRKSGTYSSVFRVWRRRDGSRRCVDGVLHADYSARQWRVHLD